jgi:hypothetical protein
MPTSVTTRASFRRAITSWIPPLGSERAHRISSLTSREALAQFSKAASPTVRHGVGTGITTVVVRPARFAGTQGAPQATACGGASPEVPVDKPPGAAAPRHVHVFVFYRRKIRMSPGPPSTTLLDLLLPFEWPRSPDPAVSPSSKVRQGARRPIPPGKPERPVSVQLRDLRRGCAGTGETRR